VNPGHDLDRLYALLGQLEGLPLQGKCLGDCHGRAGWASRGVYFFREPEEFRADASSVRRITRVGTHAVSGGSKTTLWTRLRAHRGYVDGGGNHRGSIFRLHVGAALLRRDGIMLGSWADGSSAPPEVRRSEREHERRVSDYVAALDFLWVAVLDEPGVSSRRAFIERNAIALLSNHLDPLDPPSRTWLGLHSPNGRIQQSGLWNLNHVEDAYDGTFLDVLEEEIEAMRPRRMAIPEHRREQTVVYCADIGSVTTDSFGWARIDPGADRAEVTGTSMRDLVDRIAADVDARRRIALGFECPLWIPLRDDPRDLTRGRRIDAGRPWSAAGGLGSMGVGLVQVVWVLREVLNRVSTRPPVFLDPAGLEGASEGLLLWEAFVTGDAKHQGEKGLHTGDALIGAQDFVSRSAELRIDPQEHEVYSLIGAALLRAGWSTDPTLLEQPCAVVRVRPAATS
jgi:hypothetical protein